jgi:hypothetical protein
VAFSTSATAQVSQQTTAPSQKILSHLGLNGGSVGGVQFLDSFDRTVILSFGDGADALYLELSKQSVRGENYQVRVQQRDGSYVIADPQPVSTYRGTLLGEEGSRVAASYDENGLYARIQRADGMEFWIEPVFRGASVTALPQHILYQTEQVIEAGKSCAAESIAQYAVPGGLIGASPGSGSSAGQSIGNFGGGGIMGLAAGTTAELACDADFEYYQDWGSVSATTNRIESVINTVNLQYERDVDITHAITTIIVRSSSNDPYSRKRAEQLLNQFRSEWNSNQSGVARDVAQLFTGKTISGGTIGIAWVSQVCNLSYAYSMVESDFNGNFASSTDLSAHELGHNWGAGHCSCTSYTMNPYITNANVFNPGGTIPSITSYRDSQSCFGTVTPPQDPVSIHVGSIVAGIQGVGHGHKRGTASVSIVTDTGSAGAGATVSGTFSGTFSQAVVGVTDGSGNVSFATTGTKKGQVSVTFCVDSVSGSLPYAPGDNATTCDSN